MPRLTNLIIAPVMLIAAACGRNDSRPADTALNTDLGLAAEARPYTPMDSISASERGYTSGARNARTGATAPVRRTTRTGTSSSGSTSAGGSASTTASAPRTTVEKHTKRDAAIGAAAGALIGASTSKDKVKGGLIGAAAGGILGGVIGNNVDVKRTTTP